ncbi:MAG: glycosyltransferase [Chloroflexi bacterium]|nr:glycosyltransferase [Chloroflexota bacterium]
MELEKIFHTSLRPHVLMITNHGIHQWKIIPGLPDTGGQNVFVNQFSSALVDQGFKITIINRGGFQHPITGETRTGLIYKNENQRILFLDDGLASFIRKEDMGERIPKLYQALQEHFTTEGLRIDLIISHYWDGAELGALFNSSLPAPVKHIWIPHSLGAVKKRNVNPSQWVKLRIDERIANEKKTLLEVDKVTATSAIISQSLEQDYGYQSSPLFLPPSVDSSRYRPHAIEIDHPIWTFLSQQSGISPGEAQKCQIITEISRTDTTKRKDILIKAFARVNKKFPETLLAVTIDQTNGLLAKELLALIRSLDIEKRVAVLGSVWDELPDIYAVTDIYCTPSVMEGFGMTPQEAAATKVPVVSSHLVPFVTEYLLGDEVEEIPYGNRTHSVKVGRGAIVVPADDIIGFTHALEMLLSQEAFRRQMGENAYRMTIPYFTWENMVRVFLEDSDICSELKGGI